MQIQQEDIPGEQEAECTEKSSEISIVKALESWTDKTQVIMELLSYGFSNP